MFRKTILFFVCMMAILSFTAANAHTFAAAAQSLVMAVGSESAEPGENVSIAIVIEANPGIAGLQLNIQYDNTRLRIDGVRSAMRGSAFSNLTFQSDLMSFLWFGTHNDTTIGTILTINFIVLDNAPAGHAEIIAIAQHGIARDFDGAAIPVAISQGGVRVSMGDDNEPATTTTPPPTTPAPTNAPAPIQDDSWGWWMARRAAELYAPNPIRVIQTSFDDVSADRWYYDAVYFVAQRELFSGIGGGLFAPQANMTRAMFLTVLARLDGANLMLFDESPFSDVDIDEWYGAAIAWAMMAGVINHGILADDPPSIFRPHDNITREEMAVIIYGFLAANNFALAQIDAPQFYDIADARPWAQSPINAMRRHSIIQGIGGNLYNPRGIATRAEVAQIFTNLVRAILHLY